MTALLLQPVELRRRAGEECGLFGGGIAGGDALEGVPQGGVAAAALVDREVALEHRALGAEGGEASLDIGPPGGQFLHARRKFAGVMVKRPPSTMIIGSGTLSTATPRVRS